MKFLLTLFLTAAIAAHTFAQTGVPEQAPEKNSLIGKVAPELLLRDADMNVVSISQIKTPYVILFFWDPICPPCTKLIPRLDSLYENYLKKIGCEVVGINLRTKKDEWTNFIAKYKLGWINVWDPNNETGFEKKYEIENTPMMYILDKDKKVISKTRNIEDVKYILDEVVSKEDSNSNGSESGVNDDNRKGTNSINAELPQLQAYPNPFNNGFTIYLPEFSNKISISLVSMEGRKVFEGDYEASNSTHYVDVSSQNLAAGTYIVTAQTDTRIYSCKLVKQ
jgi:peroxiredoxin